MSDQVLSRKNLRMSFLVLMTGWRDLAPVPVTRASQLSIMVKFVAECTGYMLVLLPGAEALPRDTSSHKIHFLEIMYCQKGNIGHINSSDFTCKFRVAGMATTLHVKLSVFT